MPKATTQRLRTTFEEDGIAMPDLPIRMGIFLRSKNEHLCDWPELAYEGVDRGYIHPAWEDLKKWRGSDPPLADAWDRWWLAKEDHLIHRDQTLARTICANLRAHGYDLELIYCELRELPSPLDLDEIAAAVLAADLERLLVTHTAIASRPSGVTWLGLDLSAPTETFHSAIFQPGARGALPNLPQHLNGNGLLTDEDVARRFCALANRALRGHSPYCVIDVWRL
jgi:hypothetical protein